VFILPKVLETMLKFIFPFFLSSPPQFRSNESLESSIKTSTESMIASRGVGNVVEFVGVRNVNDASEGSTTEDYATCTDNSKRNMIHPHGLPAGIRYASSSKGIFITQPTQQLTG